ncbi:hypothetical protein QQ056_12400 [Oscillatoria laete-virens NRMC-F 0139]|nr:hypothetical protein [Oscillatoria laete-virens]MDL5054338.1 hypothetical protein [Oscillatoria laete-virens NRMC-F 0139]
MATSKPAQPREVSFEDQARRNFNASESELNSVETITPPTPQSQSQPSGSTSAPRPASMMKSGATLAPIPIQAEEAQPPVATGEGFVPTEDQAPTQPATTPVPAADNPNPVP